MEFNIWISNVFVQMSIFCCCTISDLSFKSINKIFFSVICSQREGRKGLAFITASTWFSGKQRRNEKVILLFFVSQYIDREHCTTVILSNKK